MIATLAPPRPEVLVQGTLFDLPVVAPPAVKPPTNPRDLLRSVVCPETYCRAGVGERCRSRNGVPCDPHSARRRKATGKRRRARRPAGPRPTDAQAARIGLAAVDEDGEFYIPVEGDALDRRDLRVMNTMLRQGWFKDRSRDPRIRMFRLTGLGWSVAKRDKRCAPTQFELAGAA